MQTKVNDECRKQVLELRGDNGRDREIAWTLI